MTKARSRVADYLVYLAVRVVVCFVQMLTWTRAVQLAGGLGWLLHRVNKRHRLVAAQNIRHAFPDLDGPSIDRLVRATYDHWAKVLIEIIRMPRVLNHKNYTDHFPYADPADYDRAIVWARSKRPKLVLTGHFGNFEA